MCSVSSAATTEEAEMIIYELKRPCNWGTKVETFEAGFLTDLAGSPVVQFSGRTMLPLEIPLAEARKLARKILAMPLPLGFVELADA
jgi:hypothetical protein